MIQLEVTRESWPNREYGVRRIGTWVNGHMEPGSLCGLAFVFGHRALVVWWF